MSGKISFIEIKFHVLDNKMPDPIPDDYDAFSDSREVEGYYFEFKTIKDALLLFKVVAGFLQRAEEDKKK